MITPPFLRPGDTIGITAPAGWLSEAEILKGVELFQSWDLKVIYGKHLFGKKNSFAGTDEERAGDFQQMLDNKEVRAIICARGGYGSVRMIGQLNFSTFIKHPKWIVGFSDITVIHSCLQQCIQTESIHGIMPRIKGNRDPDLVSFDSLRSVLFGETTSYTIPGFSRNKTGSASGILTGGNLSVLFSIAGSRYEPETDGRILFIEDVDEYLYHIDRMIMNLRIRNKLKDLNGLIIGGMNQMKISSSGFRLPVHKIILDAVAEYDFPVMFGFPAGHGTPNLSLILGRETEMIVGKKECRVVFK